MTIQRRRFGRTGLDIPVLTYGGGWVGGLLIREEKARRERVLDRAFEAGIDWIDTAAMYGNGVSETVIGEWLAGRAGDDRPRLSTKFSIADPGGDQIAQAIASIKSSFERLGVDKVELIYLHNQIVSDERGSDDERHMRISNVLRPGGAADALDALRNEGLCDWVGLTGLGEPDAISQAIGSGRFDAAQIYYNLLNPTAMVAGGPGWNSTDFGAVLDKCRAHDMGVMGIRIFAGGHAASRQRHGREIPVTVNADNDAEEARAEAVFGALGDGWGTWAQTALRFGLACDGLSTIVVGIGEDWHLDHACEAAAMGPLPDEARAQLAKIWASDPAFRS